ncbi:MAG: hypothetical protein QOE16_626 [Microbacteriaceae bacterium]|jgi:hypothetical protein|nr:hypothetical protein [Microbacteriaceae bacterium]
MPWVEPASLRTLRWGRYRERWITGLACIAIGAGAVQLTSAYSLPFLLVGTLAQFVGWAIMPTSIKRRTAVTLPAIAASILLLAHDASSLTFFAVPLAAWLLVRQRPVVSYLVVVLPFGVSLLLARVVTGYSDAWVSLGAGTLVIIVSAWGGRWLALLAARRRWERESAPTEHSKIPAVP